MGRRFSYIELAHSLLNAKVWQGTSLDDFSSLIAAECPWIENTASPLNLERFGKFMKRVCPEAIGVLYAATMDSPDGDIAPSSIWRKAELLISKLRQVV